MRMFFHLSQKELEKNGFGGEFVSYMTMEIYVGLRKKLNDAATKPSDQSSGMK